SSSFSSTTTMLRCRKCRKGIINSTCLSMVDESSAAVCSIWHVNVDALPEWILTSVHQAQWTAGKLNCQHCGARLGGFNFIKSSKCPCGRDATVHLNKSRMDRDHKHYVLIVQPRRTRPEKERAGLLTGGSQSREQRPELNRTALDSLQLNCAAPSGFMASTASTRLSKKEKNRLKSLRRKQRRERWLHSQLEQSVSASQLSSEQEDREGLTCAVCLEVYFSPYSCQPCGHVFCEPCLRSIAKNRPTHTPCPLCRTLISHTTFHTELNQTAETFFPKVYSARRQNFQKASCAKWSLPSCRKRFRTFWGEQRQAAGRRWHFVHGGFTLDTLDFTDIRGWLFDIGLVIIYIHSVNWILAFLFFCFLMYYFFF
uniref:Ring finger protein 180b n=1 Tax=Cyclopterus lumpus TaxID=8103 RepID=A0A8C2X1V7_CYCLU